MDILRFERLWFRYPGAKEAAIAERFGLTSTEYFQVLNRLLDDPAALVAEPAVVNRLRRYRQNHRDEYGLV